MALSRRHFCSLTAVALGSRSLYAQSGASTARPDVAAIDHARIITAADRALASPIVVLTQSPPPPAPAGVNDFFAEDESTSADSGAQSRRAALLQFTLATPALIAASFLAQPQDQPRAEVYAQRAAKWLDAWLTTPATRMTPSLAFARLSPEAQKPLPEGLSEAAALAEVAKAIPFLASFRSISTEQAATWRQWFKQLAEWLDTARLAGLARDSKDHTGSSWLLLRTSIAALLEDEASLVTLRHRFRTITLRAEILAEGTFPHELVTPDPYRNSLFNLDLLAACADLLSTRFESAWNYELQDGPGMRAAIARHAPWIQARSSWPYPADLRFFTSLPCRRPSLLFAARAFQRADYADLWRTMNPDPAEPAILRSFPIRQPLLWTARPRFAQP